MKPCATSAAVIALAGALGCDAPAACTGFDEWRKVESESLDGSFVLAERDEEQRVALRVTFSDLPELWPGDGTIPLGRLTFSLRLGYEGMPADGTIQMPRLAVGEHVTSSYPPADAFGETLLVFNECPPGSEPDCCPFGARECTAERAFAVRRLEGEPFPPVEVGWTASASGGFSNCPLGGATTSTLSLTRVEP